MSETRCLRFLGCNEPSPLVSERQPRWYKPRSRVECTALIASRGPLHHSFGAAEQCEVRKNGPVLAHYLIQIPVSMASITLKFHLRAPVCHVLWDALRLDWESESVFDRLPATLVQGT